ncbi:MAG: hypothetical protein IKN04_07885 [Clostridia bacterium]|nr:hypothetical protein [Clostridia bacterium]
MKVQPAVQAETKKMALGVGVLTVLMIAVFLIIRKFDFTVLLGAILGCAAAVGNFFLMALTVQKVTGDMPVLPKKEEETNEAEDEEKERPLSDEAKQAGKKMQLSFLLRMLMLGGVAVLAISAPIFHPWAALLPMLFPRIVIALRSVFENKQKEA